MEEALAEPKHANVRSLQQESFLSSNTEVTSTMVQEEKIKKQEDEDDSSRKEIGEIFAKSVNIKSSTVTSASKLSTRSPRNSLKKKYLGLQ